MTHTPRETVPISAAERRTRKRLCSTRLIVIKLAEENGGVAADITEDGLCLAAAMPIVHDHLPSIQIRLAGSKNSIEATGQIVWKSESKRRAGVRFLHLSEEGRQQIRSWICLETSSGQQSAETTSVQRHERSSGTTEKAVVANDAIPKEQPVITAAKANQLENRTSSLEPSPNAGESVAKAEQKEAAGTESGRDGQQYGYVGPDRRLCRRRKILSFAYVEWDGSNGGVARDIGEGGLSLVSALALTGNEFVTLRFQFPETKERIEVSGRVAWKAKSGKRAGMKFVGLTEDARRRIRDWVSREAVSNQARAPKDGLGRSLAAPDSQQPETDVSRAGRFSQTLESELQPDLAGPSIHPQATVGQVNKPSLGSQYSYSAHAQSERNLAEGFLTAGKHQRPTGKLGALILLVAILSFGIGWATSSPSARNAILQFARSRNATQEPSNATVATPAHDEVPTAENEAAPAGQSSATGPQAGDAQLPTDENEGVSSQTRSISAPPQRRQNDSQPRAPREGPDSKGQDSYRSPAMNGTPSNAVLADRPVANVPQQELLSAPPPIEQRIETKNLPAPNPVSTPASVPPPLNHKDDTGPPGPPKQEVPVNLIGSVVIFADRYPSIRMPLGPGSKKSPGGERLQLGHLISRIEPVYPSDAKRDGVEGAVDMHALIGRDGSIEDLVSVNGPPLLIPAAVSAVRQWKYSETLVAGQAVETEENISIKFQLSKP